MHSIVNILKALNFTLQNSYNGNFYVYFTTIKGLFKNGMEVIIGIWEE